MTQIWTEQELNEIANTVVHKRMKEHFKKIKSLSLTHVLQHTNPFLYRGKSPDEFIGLCLRPHLFRSSSTRYGHIFEDIAKAVSREEKSPTQGLDLDILRRFLRLLTSIKSRFLTSIKSSPFWGNSQSHGKQKIDFAKAKQTIRQNDSEQEIHSILLCLYGSSKTTQNLDYVDYNICGQNSWYFLTGEKNFHYRLFQILQPIVRDIEHKLSDLAAVTHERLVEKFIEKYGNTISDDLLGQLFCENCSNWKETDLVNQLVDSGCDVESDSDKYAYA